MFNVQFSTLLSNCTFFQVSCRFRYAFELYFPFSTALSRRRFRRIAANGAAAWRSGCDPYENAVAERINETLKYEYGLNRQAANLQVLKKSVKQAVGIYNNERVHWSLGLKTPEEVYRSYNSLKYKSYSKIKSLDL
jgi:hypothetical protein